MNIEDVILHEFRLYNKDVKLKAIEYLIGLITYEENYNIRTHYETELALLREGKDE